jgi:hypothetical protein
LVECELATADVTYGSRFQSVELFSARGFAHGFKGTQRVSDAPLLIEALAVVKDGKDWCAPG